MSSPATAFSIFPALPTELRLRIWNLCILPRILEFNETLVKNEAMTGKSAHPPALLSVNRESRGEALLNYRLIFHARTDEFSRIPRSFYFFNFDMDSLYLPAVNIFQTLQAVLSSNRTRKEFERVKWIILDEYSMLLHYGGAGVVFDGTRMARLLRKCSGLQGFTIRAGKGAECAMRCESHSCSKIVRLVQSNAGILPAPKEVDWFVTYVKQCLEDVKKEHPGYRVPEFQSEGQLGRQSIDR